MSAIAPMQPSEAERDETCSCVWMGENWPSVWFTLAEQDSENRFFWVRFVAEIPVLNPESSKTLVVSPWPEGSGGSL